MPSLIACSGICFSTNGVRTNPGNHNDEEVEVLVKLNGPFASVSARLMAM